MQAPVPGSGAARPRTLLVVSGDREAVPVIAAARRAGFRVLVADGVPDAPGFRLADAGLVAPIDDPGATVEAARAYASRTPIDGVVAVGVHVPRTVAAVAEALGLPGPSPATAALIADRLALRARLRTAGLPVPWGVAVADAADLERVAARRDGGVVVRPVDGPGGRGVVRLLPGVDARWAVAAAVAASASGRAMVEDFVPGPRLRVEAVRVAGRTVAVGAGESSDAHRDAFAPFLVDATRRWAAAVPGVDREQLGRLLEAAAAAVGLGDGPLGADVVVGPRGPVLCALSARVPAGHVATHAIPLATGVAFTDAALGVAAGMPPAPDALRPGAGQAVVERRVFAVPGLVTAVQGAREVGAGEGIALADVRVRPGEVLRPARSARDAAGVVIAVGPRPEIAAARAEAAALRLRVVTTPPALAGSAVFH
jgi:biotin carboxylase